MVGGFLLKTLVTYEMKHLDDMKKKWVQDSVISIKLVAYLDSLKIKGFAIEYLAIVTGKYTEKYEEMYENMVEVLMENKIICLYGKCNGCKDLMINNNIQETMFCNLTGSIFKLDMLDCLMILKAKARALLYRPLESSNMKLKKLLPFIIGQNTIPQGKGKRMTKKDLKSKMNEVELDVSEVGEVIKELDGISERVDGSYWIKGGA